MLLENMRDTIVHRGPDDAGIYLSRDGLVGLGFRRLSIIDLSPAGHQPMSDGAERYWIVFNGEVYNFREIRAELEARSHRFTSNTDTEVVLHAYMEWGRDCLEHFIGMFAFAVWDEAERRLFAARDRMGIKPLYYTVEPRGICLASELKPILARTDFQPQLNPAVLRRYLELGYIPAPMTILENVRKLIAGEWLEWDGHTGVLTRGRYWDVARVFEEEVESRKRARSEGELMEELDGLLKDAVRYRLISDVPLGIFLSGGLDSSIVTALARAGSSGRIRTFSIGFSDTEYDEAEHARAVARHLQTDHTELYVSPGEALATIPRLPEFYDEPFADPSAIPTHIVSRLARRHVTVALSGDGGDELFGGYLFYLWMRKWLWVDLLPPTARHLAGALGSRSPGNTRAQRWLEAMAQQDVPDLAQYLAKPVWRPNELDRLLPGIPEGNGRPPARSRNPQEAMMVRDLEWFLPEDLLTKVDRASMAASLEARVPLLDHRVVRFAMRLPVGLKLHNGITKYLLRQLLYRYVPPELVDRPKRGFEIPLDRWLRAELRGLVEQYTSSESLRPFMQWMNPKTVDAETGRFLEGKGTYQRTWSIVVLAMWAEHHFAHR